MVDGQLLDTLEGRSFGKRGFLETRQGACRVMPPLPQALAELAPEVAKLAAPVVEQVAQRLAEGRGKTKQLLTIPTRLTEANRSAARDGVRVRPKRAEDVALSVPRACKTCGVVLEQQGRDHCEDCLPEELRASALAFRESGRAKLEALREAGQDPAHSDAANQLRGAKNAQRQRQFRAWDAEHDGKVDPEVFRREILAGLQGVSLGTMAKVTGLFEGYCSFIRRGIKVPHRRHWPVLRGLAEVARHLDG